MNDRAQQNPTSEASAIPLHARLTVAHVPGAERSRIATALLRVGTVIDLETGRGRDAGVLITRDVLTHAAGEAARARVVAQLGDPAALEARLSDALEVRERIAARHDGLSAQRAVVLDGAVWCDDAVERLGAAAQTAIEAARATADARRSELRSAQARLDRVLEQRAAAAAAVHAAQSELNDLDGAGLDELGLRRELEAAGDALSQAEAAHAQAVADLAALDRRHAEINGTLASLVAGRAALEQSSDRRMDLSGVQRALAEYEAFASIAPLDGHAQALAADLQELDQRLAEVNRSSAAPPSPAEMRDAERAFEAASARLQSAIEHVDAISPAERVELDAAHATVLAAEERANGRARKERELEEARAAERALLERHGFTSYLDVVLTGGRKPHDQRERVEAEREHADASRRLEALRERAQQGGRAELEAQRALLLAEASRVLYVDPGTNAVELLTSHPLVPADAMQTLSHALDVVGAKAAGQSLAATAAQLLADDARRVEAAEQTSDRLRAISAEHATAMAELRRIEAEIASAQHALDRAYAVRDQAQRAVRAIEAELTERVGGDSRRVERITAAQRLRAQVESVERTLVGAEREARAALDAAADAASQAEIACDRAEAAVADVRRRMFELNAAVPDDIRPDLGHGVADGAAALAAALRETAARLDRALDATDAELDEATGIASAIADDLREVRDSAARPTGADIAVGLARLLGASTAGLAVLDDPFPTDLDRDDALEALLRASATRPVALLTDDPQLLGWAIELPADIGSVIPSRVLTDHLPAVDRKATSCASASERS